MSINPRTPDSNPFIRDFWPKLHIKVIPRSTRANNSGAPNFSANFAIIGETSTRQRRLIIPPIKEDITATPIASPALPFFANSCPSSAVADADGVPGILRRIADIDPPVIPDAYNPSSIQIEVTGFMVNVRGSRRTIPREMVKPGVDPINNPKSTPNMLAVIL